MGDVDNLWKTYLQYFKKEVLFISTPFLESAQKAYYKLLDLYVNIAENGIETEISGITIPMMSGNVTARFIYSKILKNGSSQNVMFGINREGVIVYFFSGGINHNMNGLGWVSNSLIGHRNGNPFRNESDKIQMFQREFIDSIVTLMFKKYAEVETKHLKPGQKIKDIDCNYKNETKSNITILDSKWFTNLVKSDAFKVRGHFRLQPCGHGLKDRKLIWINEFMKDGYTAPARKLNEDGE